MTTHPLVPANPWEAIPPLLPKGGRLRIPDRAARGGFVFVLRTGCP